MATSEAIDVTPQLPLAPAERAPALPAVNAEALLASAIEKNVPIETLERLLALREKLNAEAARTAFFDALSRFQARCPVIPKTKTAKIEGARGSYSYSYAPLEVIVARVQQILEECGLSVTFNTRITEGDILVSVCTVHHIAGHSESSDFQVPIDRAARMNDAQKVASASTYAKRYAFCNALGILTGDDDDDAHSGGTKQGERPTGGPTDFGTPPRASAKAPAATSTEPGAPADAISQPQAKRVYALIHTALKAKNADNEANVDAVESELDRLTQEHTGRAKWQHIAKQDYDRVCAAIEPIVAKITAAPRSHARLVRR